MKQEDAKDGLVVQGRGKTGMLNRQPNGWDVVTDTERMQSVDLSEWRISAPSLGSKIKPPLGKEK